MTKALYLGTSLQFAAEQPVDGKPVLPSKFSGVAYSGDKIPGYNAVVDLATTDVAPKMHLLHEHERPNILGVIQQSANSGENITVGGNMYSHRAGSLAETVAQHAQDGSPYEMSIGIFGFRTDSIPAGEKVTVNKREFTGPIDVLRGGKVREVSVCALGADWGTSVEMFSQQQHNPQESSMTQAEIDALKAQLAAATAESERLKAAETARAAAEKTASAALRAAAITALEMKVGTAKFTDAEKAAFAEMSDASFTIAAARMTAQSDRLRTLDPKLFQEQGTGDATASAATREAKILSDAAAKLSSPDAIFAAREKKRLEHVKAAHHSF